MNACAWNACNRGGTQSPLINPPSKSQTSTSPRFTNFYRITPLNHRHYHNHGPALFQPLFLPLCLCAKSSKMCPLRLILIFLSATLAGFFVLKNLKSKPETENPDDSLSHIEESELPVSRTMKVFSAIGSGFWTCVDMASGKYLWRHFVASKQS